jgi:NADH-quinone oxidoreductase subunit N
MALLMLGVFRGDTATRLGLLAGGRPSGRRSSSRHRRRQATPTTFGGQFVVDRFADFMKVLVLIGSALSLAMSPGLQRARGASRASSTRCWSCSPPSACDDGLGQRPDLALYVGLELQSLPLYVLAAFRRDQLRSTEAGLKYFVLGALASGMLLYGCSLVYGFAGTTSSTAGGARSAEGATAGSHRPHRRPRLHAAGLAFKVSAVPFHMWTPDVYEGAPTPVTAFFAAAPKVAAVAPVRARADAAVRRAGGRVAADHRLHRHRLDAARRLRRHRQTNIKRLMAYSSIGHVGYALVGLAAGTEEGIAAS